MSSDIVNKVEARGIGAAFADKFMEYLRSDFRGGGPARVSTIYITIRDMRRTAYPTLEAFITDLQHWHSQGDNIGLKTPAYNLMMIVLKALGDMPHLDHFMHIKRAEFHNKGIEAMQTFTIDDFYKQCVKILNFVRPMEEKAGFASGATYAGISRGGR